MHTASAQDDDEQVPQISPELSEPESTTNGDSRLVLLADTRLRYEYVNTLDQPSNGEALTLRVRPSVELSPVSGLSFLAEAEAIVSLLPDRLNGFVSGSTRPGIADEETLELNRLQVSFGPSDGIDFTLGRQRISLDDERFIGIVDFRQNQQTYDAATMAIVGPANLTLRAGYIWRVGRVLGPERPDGVFDSDSFYVNAALPLMFGQISAFHYDLDLDDRAGQKIRSRTTGGSLRGRAFPSEFGLFWELGYAKQESESASPEYARAALKAERGEVALSVKFERLGSEDGVAFQTPLATLHRFQGPADLFLTTPAQGIEDIEVNAVWRLGSLGPARGTRLSVQYNSYTPANGPGKYGDEWSGEIGATIASTRMSAAVAHYRAQDFASDTTRLWLTIARKF
ncbi:MAG: hypothetical protein AAGL10_05785 [Pseudomonadota bacterium]